MNTNFQIGNGYKSSQNRFSINLSWLCSGFPQKFSFLLRTASEYFIPYPLPLNPTHPIITPLRSLQFLNQKALTNRSSNKIMTTTNQRN